MGSLTFRNAESLHLAPDLIKSNKSITTYEPLREKTNNVVSEQVRHQTKLYKHRKWPEA